jgi:hypothetical protein
MPQSRITGHWNFEAQCIGHWTEWAAEPILVVEIETSGFGNALRKPNEMTEHEGFKEQEHLATSVGQSLRICHSAWMQFSKIPNRGKRCAGSCDSWSAASCEFRSTCLYSCCRCRSCQAVKTSHFRGFGTGMTTKSRNTSSDFPNSGYATVHEK